MRSLLTRRPTRIAIGATLALITLLGLRAAFSRKDVETTGVTKRDIVSTLAVVGRVRAASRTGLGAPLAGTVSEVRVEAGDVVERGQVLVLLDDREPRALLAEAEAALAERIAASAEGIAQAERDSAQAAREAERTRALFDQGAVTRKQLEQDAQRAADAAGRLGALRSGGTRGAGEPAAVTRARATRDAAEARLALTRVRAPSAGTVLARTVEPGDVVAPGQALLDLALDGPTELTVFPSEEMLPSLRVGGSATATADAFPDSVFAATVVRVAPAVDPTQGTVEVRLSVPTPPSFLRPDMTVSVNLESGRAQGASVIPETAVGGLGTATPWVALVRDGRVERADVRLGLRAPGFVEILEGVGPDDRVVTDPAGVEIGERVRDLGEPRP